MITSDFERYELKRQMSVLTNVVNQLQDRVGTMELMLQHLYKNRSLPEPTESTKESVL